MSNKDKPLVEETIWWCPVSACGDFILIARSNAAWCGEGHALEKIGFINSRGEQVSTDIKMPKQVFPDA